MSMSLIDEIAAGDANLDTLKISDLGIDINSLGWTETDDGVLTEVVRENDKHSMNLEEAEWLSRVLDSCRRIHATGLARLYVCREGQSQWEYNGLYGAAAIVTEADLRMACAHFIRLVDLGGFNPNSSVILQQELYKGFQYNKITPWFHSFEMNHYVAGLSFATEEAAEKFYEQVQYCCKTEARDVVEDDVDSKEKTFKMIGDSDWRTVNDSLSVGVARKYAGGGITDGTEVNWNKKKELPAELAAALGQMGLASDDSQVNTTSVSRGNSEDKIDLMRDPTVRRSTISTSDKITDGVTVQWSKNKTPLTGTDKSESARSATATKPTKQPPKGASAKNLFKKFKKF